MRFYLDYVTILNAKSTQSQIILHIYYLATEFPALFRNISVFFLLMCLGIARNHYATKVFLLKSIVCVGVHRVGESAVRSSDSFNPIPDPVHTYGRVICEND